MAEISPSLQRAVANTTEYQVLGSHLAALLSFCPPSFIYIHDPYNVRLTTTVIRSTLTSVVTDVPNLRYACVNAVACFSSRILFDTALNTFAGWTPDWNDGAQNWQAPGAEARRYNESFDAFVHGLQAIQSIASTNTRNNVAKGKARAEEHRSTSGRMILVVERAERLKDNMPELIAPLTRLAEMVMVQSQIELTTIFISEVQWQSIRPSLRASPEPYYIDVPGLSKNASINILASSFPPEASTSRASYQAAYHPSLKPLYAHFITSVYSICGPFTNDPLDLSYIAAARWPGFVQPILDARYQQLHEDTETIADAEELEDLNEIPSIDEDARIRLLRLFTPSLTAALDALYPRINNAMYWSRIHAPPSDILTIHPGQAPAALVAQVAANIASLSANASGLTEARIDGLPRIAKFVLIAAFLASTNPARSDLRMFGRGLDERKRRRRKMGTPRKPKPGLTGTAVKLPQRLLGPLAFPVDRMIAMLGVLLEENDADARPVAPQYTLPGEYTEMEIARVSVYATIAELASMRLLVRTSHIDSLDRTPTFKCGIGYDLTVRLARSIGIVLNDLIYEIL